MASPIFFSSLGVEVLQPESNPASSSKAMVVFIMLTSALRTCEKIQIPVGHASLGQFSMIFEWVSKFQAEV
jgi:hypothetical protein